MKISLWPKRLGAFVKNIGVYWIPVFLILLIIGVFVALGATVAVQSKRIHEKFPIGKHVVIKGTGLQGTISKVSGCGCEIEVLVVENGKLEKINVDGKMLE